MATTNTARSEKPDLQAGIALGNRIAALAARISVSQSEFLELVRRFDEDRWWDYDRKRSCAHWLSWRCGVALVTAREWVRVARALPGLTVVRDRFKEGRLCYTQVRDITRAAKTVEDEKMLVDAAAECSGAQLTRICRKILQRRAAKEPPRAAERFVRWRTLESGLLQLDARLLPEEGLIVRNALDAAARRLTTTVAALTTAEGATPAVDAATPSVEGPSVGGPSVEGPSVEGPSVEGPSVEPKTATAGQGDGPRRVSAQRLADSLVAVSSSYLEGTNDAHFATRHVVGVLIDFETLLGLQHAHGAPRSQLLQGAPISLEAVKRLGCDGLLRRVILDERRVPIDVGRKRRTIPDKLLWALWVRDGGCRFPDCSTRVYLSGHHIVHWEEGGPTDLANLLLLCGRHHWLVHEGGYGCECRGERVVFLDPHGRELPATGARFLDAPEAPAPGAAAGSCWKEVRHWVDDVLELEACAKRNGSDAA